MDIERDVLRKEEKGRAKKNKRKRMIIEDEEDSQELRKGDDSGHSQFDPVESPVQPQKHSKKARNNSKPTMRMTKADIEVDENASVDTDTKNQKTPKSILKKRPEKNNGKKVRFSGKILSQNT